MEVLMALIFDVTDEMLKKDYEIVANIPSWHMTKYIMENSDKFKGDTDLKEVSSMFDDILKECVIKWREKGSEKWITETDTMPNVVASAVIGGLIEQSQRVGVAKVRTEKN
jgi:hypothetical protein